MAPVCASICYMATAETKTFFIRVPAAVYRAVARDAKAKDNTLNSWVARAIKERLDRLAQSQEAPA